MLQELICGKLIKNLKVKQYKLYLINSLVNKPLEKRNYENIIIRPISEKESNPIHNSKDEHNSSTVLNSSQNISFNDTKEKLKHYNMISNTPLSLLKNKNNY